MARVDNLTEEFNAVPDILDITFPRVQGKSEMSTKEVLDDRNII